MFNFLKKINNKEIKVQELDQDKKNILISSLLLECAKEDGDLSLDEKNHIKVILSNKFKLNEKDINLIFKQAVDDLNARVEIYSIVKNVRDIFSSEEILDLFVYMWEIILVDEVIDDYEAGLMRKMVGLFHITDRESAEAKKIAQKNLNTISQ